MSANMFIFDLLCIQEGERQVVEVLDKSLNSFQDKLLGSRVFWAAMWAGGTHETGSETHFLRPKLGFC